MPVLGLGLLSQYQSYYNVVENYDIANENENIDNIETTKIDEDVKNETAKDVPLLIKAAIAFFFFFYVGVECGYGGWISTYVLEKNVTDSSSAAAFTSAIFWGSLTVGRVMSIIFALFMKGHTMLKIQVYIIIIITINIIIIIIISMITIIIINIIIIIIYYSSITAVVVCCGLCAHSNDKSIIIYQLVHSVSYSWICSQFNLSFGNDILF